MESTATRNARKGDLIQIGCGLGRILAVVTAVDRTSDHVVAVDLARDHVEVTSHRVGAHVLDHVEKVAEVARTTDNLSAHNALKALALFPLTDRQHAAVARRVDRLVDLERRHGRATYRPCVGCLSGIRTWNQGSDYCGYCLRRDSGR